MIDSRGRLFGVVNLIDLALAMAAIAVIGLSAAAYRVFRIPDPILDRVEPAEVMLVTKPRIALVGRHMRHYLRAFVPRAGEPFAVTTNLPDGPEARAVSVTEDRMELELPALTPGAYDLYLFDDAKRVAYRARAFTIVPPRYPQGRVEVHIQTFLAPGTVQRMAAGDVDTLTAIDPTLPNLGPARVAAVHRTDLTTEDREIAFAFYSKESPYASLSVEGKRDVVDVMLMVPVVGVRPGRWEYKKTAMRVGERLLIETEKYKVAGPIVAVGDVQPWP
jgi:hypothetical protein